MINLKNMDWSWATDGITESIPRTSGPECSNYLSTRRKIFECILVSGLCIWLIKRSIQKLQPIILHSPYQKKTNYYRDSSKTIITEKPTPIGKQILLIAMTFVFGMEIGFKLSTKTFIYVFNPCHITTIIQIYLLATKPSKRAIALFRIQMNYLNGPFLAFVFPDAESRHLPLEQATYWIQHGLMFIISIYLLRLDGEYSMEYILDFKWNIIGYSTMILYHFTVLQFLSMASGVNLNYMLCPAISDPFQGSNYRIAAVIHQAILCPFLCKLFTIIFSNTNQIQVDVKVITNNVDETMYSNTNNDYDTAHQQQHHYHYDYHPSQHDQLIYDKMTGLGSNIVKSSSSSLIGASIASSGLTTATAAVLSSSPAATNIIPPPVTISRIDDPIMTTKID